MYMFINDVFLNARCFMYVHIKMHGDMCDTVTAHGQALSSPLTYSLSHVFSLAISAPMQGAYWLIYPLK